ncbi:MAG: UbiX family flavin prenyltransferase [Nitrospirota bacterium]
MKRYVLGMTGASGQTIGLRVLQELAREAEVHLVVSSHAFFILREETGIDFSGEHISESQEKVRTHVGSRSVHLWDEHDMDAPAASGSYPVDAMLVVPCSMKTLAAVASGFADTLITRAADVTLKEGRRLVLSPRETPLSAIHLENMLKLARLGVRICPPVAAFYSAPQSIEDMVDFWAGKILDSLGVPHNAFRRWGAREPQKPPSL